ncbi:MAG TPA: hypothetical protein PK771_08330, partial [Spirochaetota bacterium]|nr:hypothetical protein [Spirochaetota bacterium]
MAKKILLIIFTLLNIILYSSIIIPDYKLNLPFDSEKKDESEKKDDKKSEFLSFKLGNIPGDLTILGNWKVKLGFGTGFVLYPELMWLTNVPNMREGVIFEQERLFALDWTTENGINLHLFFNDDLEQSEFTFKYELGKIFNSIYITNKFSDLKLNPYRNMKGGKVSDINVGFDWGHKFYKGRFDIQFDSTKKVTDSFKGNNKFIQNKIYSSNFVRGIYYYLPDKNITGEMVVYISSDNGEKLENLPNDFKEARKYKRIYEGTDFSVNTETGKIVFKESLFGKTLLIYYQIYFNGQLYNVGDVGAGINGVYGTKDFNKDTDKEYFVIVGDKRFLILSFQNSYSYFEEKNSYKIASNGINATNLNLDIFDSNNIRVSGFNYFYDSYTGCIRITKENTQNSINYIYPFFDSVTDKSFYLNNNTPKERESKNIISYEAFVSSENLKLSQKPVNGSITLFINSTQIESKFYSYDFTTQSVSLSLDIKDTDTIDIYYIADENDAYNLTATLKNDFKLNEYLMLSDSIWYKMPVKLWENSVYNKLHSGEFLYNVTLNGDYKKFIFDAKNGKLTFNINTTFSLFIPELKGITIVEDFEQEKKGYSLPLEYKNYFPVSLPKSVYSVLNSSTYGKLFFRNTHNLGITTNGNYISLYNNPPEKDEYSPDGKIGPYSSSDGYYGEKNSLSLVTEFELKQNEAVSVAIPLSNKDFDWTGFNQVVAAIKSLDLNGTVNIFLDAGLVSERFNENDLTPQKETLDEGI